MSLAGLVERYRAAIYLLAALLTVGGVYALYTLPAAIYPEVAYPRIVVLARGGTFEAQEMVVAATRPLEQAMSGLLDLRKIRARTVRGSVELSLDFRPQADMQLALSQVQARLAALQPELPREIAVSAERLTPSVFPVLQYELVGADPVMLRDLAEFTVRPRLAGLPDVGEVGVQGGRVRELSVQLDPSRLISNRVSMTQVAQAIQATDVAVAAGRVDRAYKQFTIVVSALTNTPDQLAQVVVRHTGDRVVRVGDLGSVRYAPADQFQIVTGNGQPAALVNVARQPKGSTLRVRDAVQAAIDSIRPLLPAGVRLESVYDQAALVGDSIRSVRDAMLIGGALAVLVLFLLLGRVRTTFAAALTLPITVAITLLGLWIAGDTLNLMSLGGLAVAVGLIIDDGVVVVENIERRLAAHPDQAPGEVIRMGTDEIFGPVAGSTLTTVVVFIPLGLLQGVVGDFFRSFALALSIAVLLSLVVAMTLIPAIAIEWTRRRGTTQATEPPLPHLGLEHLQGRYGRVVGWALRRRHLVLLGMAGLLLGSLALTRIMGTGFLPQMDEGGFILDYWAPPGGALSETNRQVQVLEHIVARDPDVVSFTRRTGLELGFAATLPNSGDFTVRLKARGQRRSSVYQVIDRIRTAAEQEAPAVRVEFVQLLQDVIGDLAGAPAPVELKLFSTDQAAAERAAVAVAKAIEPTSGLVDLYNGVPGKDSELRIALDPVRVARLGLSPDAVEADARAALFGAEAGSARESDRLIPIRVRFPDSVRSRPDVAERVPIVGPQNWAPLSQLGSVRDTAAAGELLRENLRPLVAVTGRVEGRSLGSVMRDVRSAVAKVPLPAAVRLEIGGQYASQQQSFRELMAVLALAIGAVLAVLVTQFRGFRGPLAIVLVVPLGLTGAIIMLTLTGVQFNVSSFMGVILLVGLIVKNGILLLDAAMHARRNGLGQEESLVQAGQLRLRPILMTTLCTLVGLTPLALGLGSGAELQRPLAIAVIGGLAVSTAVTLLVLPTMLELLGALRQQSVIH
ncbi:MAG TPA: efflux RND transporter permease subunit [Gemmatimonadales bacterium]|nr:efflux RND transporter permease subunit [Gemmatimonadales bacterium]